MEIEIEKEYWSNGNLKYRYPYLNNNRHGIFRDYYSDGKKEGEWKCIDDMCQEIDLQWG